LEAATTTIEASEECWKWNCWRCMRFWFSSLQLLSIWKGGLCSNVDNIFHAVMTI